MARSSSQSDLRVVKTRAALQDAMETLLREKPFEKITVQEICDRALVSRTAFYAHYHDKYALFHATITARFAVFGDRIALRHTSFEEALVELLSFLRQDATLQRRASIGAFDFEVLEMATELLSTHMLDQIDTEQWRVKSTRVDAASAATFATYGVAGIVAQWVREGFAHSEQDTAHAIILLLKELFEPAQP